MTVDEFCRQTLSEPGMWPHIIIKDSFGKNKGSIKTIQIKKDLNKNHNLFDVPQIKPNPVIFNDFSTKKLKSSIGLGMVGNTVVH